MDAGRRIHRRHITERQQAAQADIAAAEHRRVSQEAAVEGERQRIADDARRARDESLRFVLAAGEALGEANAPDALEVVDRAGTGRQWRVWVVADGIGVTGSRQLIGTEAKASRLKPRAVGAPIQPAQWDRLPLDEMVETAKALLEDNGCSLGT
jgi:hypothetical protein